MPESGAPSGEVSRPEDMSAAARDRLLNQLSCMCGLWHQSSTSTGDLSQSSSGCGILKIGWSIRGAQALCTALVAEDRKIQFKVEYM